MSSSSTSKTKATWTPAFHEIFVDLCLEETEKGNRPGTHFTKEGWRNIHESFYEKTGVRYDKVQFKNHWDATKEQWKNWHKLTGTSNMKWDPVTNTFGASEEDWANYIQAHPEAALFRNKELQLTDKLDTIFDGIIITDKKKLPTRRRRKSDSLTVKTECLSKADELRVTATVKSAHRKKIQSEKGTSNSSHEKVKANWTPALHKLFIDLCLEQTLEGNKPGSHFTKEGWRNIEERFSEKVGLKYERKQLKNHWSVTKDQWKVWCKLIATSNMKWDPNTKTFGASEEDWANYLQASREAAQFRFQELQFMDELGTIFGGTVVSGEMERPAKRGRHDDSSNTSVLHTEENGVMTLEGRNDNPCDIVESRSAFTVQSIPHKFNYSIGECIECLDGMEEVEQGNDLYMFALDIFLKREYREIFLQLKKPSLRIAWLRRLQSVGPPLL